jgi:hypothetical protein
MSLKWLIISAYLINKINNTFLNKFEYAINTNLFVSVSKIESNNIINNL